MSHTNCTLGSKLLRLQPSVPVGCQLNLQLQHTEDWLEHWEPAAAVVDVVAEGRPRISAASFLDQVTFSPC